MKSFCTIAVMLSVMFILSLMLPQPAFAHVLITDTTKEKGAVIHVMPDDDPIAGEVTEVYFDGQSQLFSANSKVTMTVQTDDGASNKVEMAVKDSLAIGKYTFPTQGVYRLIFEVQGSQTGQTYTFEHTQRVSRGVAGGGSVEVSHEWAKLLLVASGTVLCLLGILAFRRRKAIARQSTF